MIKKYIVLFVSVFLLMIREGFAMQSEEMDPARRFMPVFRQIVRFQEFLSGPQPDIAESADLSSQSKMSLKKANQVAIDSDLAFANKILEFGELLLQGKLSGDQFFQETLLETRLQYLVKRTEKAIQSIDKKDFLLPSDSELLSHIAPYLDLKSSNATSNNFAIRRNIQRYQFLNFLCSTHFKIMRREELSKRTIGLLRASPHLWSLLKDETIDLGHPDEAGGFAIVKAYLKHPFSGSEGLAGLRGLNSLEKAAKRIEQKYPCPLWYQEKLFNDAELYKAHFKGTGKNYFIPFKGLGCSGSEGVWLQNPTPFEYGLWKDPLPFPSFLRPFKPTGEEEIILIREPSFFETFPFEELDEKEEEIPIPAGPILLQDVRARVLESQDLVIASTEEEFVSDSRVQDVETIKIPVSASNNSTARCSSSSDFVMPSGIRKFHALMPTSSYAIRELDRNDQDFIDDIFHDRKFSSITYKEFKYFWESQKGRITTSHGGSHHLLIGPKGDSLFGTYTHGGGQTYTRKTIKYLRAALWYIGCRPSN